MKKKSKRTLTPKLRFPKFRDKPGWEEAPLEQIAERVTTKNFDGSVTRVLTNSAEHGVVDQRDYFDKDIANAGNIDRYYIVDLGDYVYNPRVSTLAPVGPISRNNIGKGVMSPLYTVFRFTDENTDFYQHYFKSVSWHLYLRRVSSMGARHDRMSITTGDFMAMPVPTPLPQEQQKIADCLSSADGLITAEDRKLEALRNHKRGLMQQLFPQPGQTQPRLRFPEFRGKGEWEEKEVGEVFKVTRGEVLAMPLVKDERTEDAPYPVYSSQTKNVGLAGYYSQYLYEDAITWTTDGANAGDVNYRPGKFFCTNVCGVLISDKGFANPCTAALINSVSRQHVSYVGNPKLMNGVMAKIRVAFPPPVEQQKIAYCLSALDTQITTQAAKIDALKTHKRGLMQQIFPAPEEQ